MWNLVTIAACVIQLIEVGDAAFSMPLAGMMKGREGAEVNHGWPTGQEDLQHRLLVAGMSSWNRPLMSAVSGSMST